MNKWTVFICPECDELENLDAFDADYMRASCINYQKHPLNEERKEWPEMDRIEVVRLSQLAEREAIIKKLADFIEENIPGSQVYRHNGMIVT